MEICRHGKSVAMIALCALVSVPVTAEPATPDTANPAALRDGQHDFDFNLGNWRTHIKLLRKAASGPDTWVEFDGAASVRKIWGGRAQLEEIEADGGTGHLEALTLFLYNPQAHQWSKVFADSSDGELGQAMVGEFKGGRGEFFDQESYRGRTVLMRAVWSDITANSQHFEESFSADGGKTWKPCFVAAVTRQSR